MRTIAPEDLSALRLAVQSLEHPGLAARLTNMVGKPIELIGHALPKVASQAIATATSKGLEIALRVALRTMQRRPVELPVSTIIMLRSIADIARSEGEDLSDPETALSCVEVFALGGRTGSTDASESGYFAVRGMLAKTVTEAARFIAERGIIEQGAPVLVRFVTQVASRFGAVVTQKVAAQALPIMGALGGAVVNYAFIEHFQQTAKGHFTVRRLERVYGKDLIKAEYERLAADVGTKHP
jgi:EcsC protein family